jgi:hypothetical protein
MSILSLIGYVTGAGVLIAVFTYLGKIFIEKSADAAIERYKSNLQQEIELYKHKLNKETEKLKFDLNLISLEHQIRYNSLYIERGKIIQDIYSRILKIERELLRLTTIWQGPEWINTDNDLNVKASITSFEEDFEEKRLFFNQAMCDSIESLIGKMKKVNQEMYEAKIESKSHRKYEESKDIIFTTKELLKPRNTWFNLENEVKQDIKKVRRDLERDFAKLIGVE